MPTPAAARPRVVAGLRLVARVGEGGEGEVWEARDGLGRRRALKLIRPDALVPPAEVERRGRWLLAIDHPALVVVHRCGVLAGAGLDGWGFVEMDFVEGPSLEVAPADPAALERLAPLAEALDLLHAGVWSDGVPLIHRDVKPANLIEQDEAGLVLVDTSTLREVDDGTRTRIGTPLFAAPEVVTGRAGPLADVYSLAATAVALLTGARRGDLADLLADPDALDVPQGVRAALAPDPAARPVSCRAALDPSLPLVVGAEVGWGPTEHGVLRDDGDGGPAGAWGPLDAGHGGVPAGEAVPAADVMLEPWTDPHGPEPPPPWGWLVLLGLLPAYPLAAATAFAASGARAGALLGASVAAVVAAGAAGQPLLQALLLPPMAWASLLSERVAGAEPVRGWVRATLLTGTAAIAGLTAGAVLRPGLVAPVVAVSLVAAAWGVVVLTVLAGRGSRLLRALLAPAWAVGALLLLLGVAILLAPGVLVGRVRSLLRVVRTTVGGARAFVQRG